jgi:hypothetical protein
MRTDHEWSWLFVLNLVINWLVPFLILMPRSSKRKPEVLSWDENTYIANPNREEYIPLDESQSNGSSPKEQG